MAKTKIIPYGRQWISEKDIQSVESVLRSDWITQGPAVSQFEDQFAKKVKVPWAVAVSSGTAGLHLAVLAERLDGKDEVLVPAITFVATANSIVYSGATPRIVDIDPGSGNISLQDLERKINKRTRGIIPVHFAGNPAPMREIGDAAKKHGLFVIEDSCHALGARYRNEPVGNRRFSDASVFSFHPVKHITTGEGGMITGKLSKYRDWLIKLRNHGITRSPGEFMNGEQGTWYYEQQELGFNYRITDFQCALGLSQLERLDEFVAKRRQLAERYRKAFLNEPAIECLEENPEGRCSYHLFVIKLNLERLKVGRKVIFEELSKRGIGVQVHYIPLHYHPFYRKRLGLRKGDLPQAEKFYERVISLPLFPQLPHREQDRVIETLKKVLSLYQKKS